MDDLLDLSFGSPSISNASCNSNSKPPMSRKDTSSSFDYLSASIARPTISLTPIPSSNSNSNSNSNPSSSRLASSSIQASRSAGTIPSDAFSSLFANRPDSHRPPNSASTMTISERLKAAEHDRMNHSPGSQYSPGLSAFSGLATRSSSPNPVMGVPTPTTLSATRSPLQQTIFSSTSSRHPSPHPLQQSDLSADPWDLDFLESTSRGPSRAASPALAAVRPITPSDPAMPRSRKDSWDIDLNLEPSQSSIPSGSGSTLQPTRPTLRTQASLLGDEFGPLEGDEQRTGPILIPNGEDDDILGLLGVPAIKIDSEEVKHDATKLPNSHTGNTNGNTKPSVDHASHSNRSPSPPPHVLGQVVEMGFSIPQARQALNHTWDSGTGQWNIAAAVESLVVCQGPLPTDMTSHSPQSQSPPTSRAHYNRKREDIRPIDTSPQLLNAKEIQDQAADLLAQASAYGSSAFGKAASFWKQGKASISKAIEDQTSAASGSGRIADGGMMKPRWMKDAQPNSASDGTPSAGPSPTTPFTDHAGPSNPNQRHSASTSRQPSPQERSVPEPRQAYVSSARRKVAERSIKKPVTDQASDPDACRPARDVFTSMTSDLSPALPSTPAFTPPVPTFDFPQLPVVSITQSQMSASLSHRHKGNEWFKQGQYANAESAYTHALDSLEVNVSDHAAANAYFGCLPLLNNRAAARLKNGDGKGANEDVDRVIEILLGEDHQMKQPLERLLKRMESSSARVPDELKEGLDVSEQLGKALSRRAKIREEAEKWVDAKADWEFCRKLGGAVMKGAGGLKIVGEGLTRCMKAITPLSGSRASQPLKVNGSQRPPRPTLAPTTQATVAVQKLRAANELAEQESNQKLESKDFVDAKVGNWKNGKETNLRALLASLDQVLWERLEWKKIGMGELLTEGQVKSRYVRAISKVHPDKIPKDASVEEQMIAKSVFAALNEAWIAMQG